MPSVLAAWRPFLTHSFKGVEYGQAECPWHRARLLHITPINVMKSRSSYARGGFFIAARCDYCRKRAVNSITATITKQNVRSCHSSLTYIAAPLRRKKQSARPCGQSSVIHRAASGRQNALFSLLRPAREPLPNRPARGIASPARWSRGRTARPPPRWRSRACTRARSRPPAPGASRSKHGNLAGHAQNVNGWPSSPLPGPPPSPELPSTYAAPSIRLSMLHCRRFAQGSRRGFERRPTRPNERKPPRLGLG